MGGAYRDRLRQAIPSATEVAAAVLVAGRLERLRAARRAGFRRRRAGRKDRGMALERWGFIYTGRGNDPARTIARIGSEACMLIAVGVERPDEGVEVARWLVAEGVQLIEL